MKASNFKLPRGYSYCESAGKIYHVTLRAGRVMPLCGRTGWVFKLKKIKTAEVEPDVKVCLDCRKRLAHRQAREWYEAALRATSKKRTDVEAALGEARLLPVEELERRTAALQK